jgi:CubicO group peptidase (beta-lactamase class C family)
MRSFLPALVLVAFRLYAAEATLDGFDAFVEGQLKEWKAPGAAVVVVKDGKAILAKGYGLRNVKENLPVTTKTLFAIGSSSKSFTVVTLALLVDQGKLEWDKPVRDYLPDFRMHDAAATERMTPRDLVTHRSGLPRHDLMWYGSPLTRQQIYERLRYLEPSKDFRSTWQYQNIMYMTAGYLAGRVAGTSWEDLVRRSIFTPLGMTSSNLSVSDSRKSGDYALPYRTEKEQIVEIPFRNIDEIGPAGSINSNVEDMTAYLLMQLNRGRHGGKPFLAESTVRQMHAPQVVMPGESRYKEVGASSYGLGWMISTYQGRKLVQHGGNIDGFSALVAFLPAENIGTVILTNSNGSQLPGVLSRYTFDRLLGIEPVAWTQRIRDEEKQSKAAQEAAEKKQYTPRRPNTRPSHEIAEYAGEYEHPAYGVIKVEAAGAELRASLNAHSSVFKHFHYDVFEAPEAPGNPLQRSKIQFHTGLDGSVESLSIPLDASLKPVVFPRRPDAAFRERKYLEQFTGSYAIGPQTAVVSFRDERTLVVSTGGQPPVELAPTRESTFALEGMTGFSVEFKKDAAGAVVEAVFHQPNGSFAAPRK